jgi:hypothetical protein
MNMHVRGGPGDLLTLVRERAVQDELKVTDKQKQKLDEWIGQIDDAQRERLQNALRAARENGAPADPKGTLAIGFAANPQGNANPNQENEQALAQILQPRQLARLKQIALQQEGLMAVARDEIAEKINLSPQQGEAIHAVIDDMRQAQAELMRSFTGGTGMVVMRATGRGEDGKPQPDKESMARFRKMHEGREQLQKAALQQINKLLSKKQGAAFTKLMGEPFDFSKVSDGGKLKLPFDQTPKGSDAPGAAPADSAQEKASQSDQPKGPRRRQGRNPRPQ